MRVLVSTAPMVGHLYPTVALCWALRAEGHSVLVATPPSFADKVRACGLPGVALPEVDLAAAISRDRAGRSIPPDYDPAGRVQRSGRGWARFAAGQLPAVRALVDAWRPDLVVTDPLAFSGQLAAAAAGVPWVEHGWGVAPSPLFGQAAEAELVPELSGYGLAGLPVPTVRLDLCPPSVQRPDAPPGRPMRCVPFSGAGTVPEWLAAPRSRPLVCLTFGSHLPRVNPGQALGLLRDLMATLPGLGADLAVGLDPGMLADLQPLPPGVCAGWLPLDHVIPASAAVVHYGGSGVMMTALTAGVPQLVLAAQVADAPDNAARVAAAGIGLCLQPEECAAANVAAACEELLRKPQWQEQATLVAAAANTLPTPAATVPVLAGLTD